MNNAAGDLEENKIFKDIALSGHRSGKGDDDRTSNKPKYRDEIDRIFGKKSVISKPKKTKIIYHSDGTKTEITREF